MHQRRRIVPLEKEIIMPSARAAPTPYRSPTSNTWSAADARAIYELPFNDLLFRAHSVHRENFNPNQVQLSKLLSIKTGGCPEDCGYCSQSARSATGLNASKLMGVDQVIDEARKAKDGRYSLLHGGSLAEPERARYGCCCRDGQGRKSAESRDVHDTWHALNAAGRNFSRSRA